MVSLELNLLPICDRIDWMCAEGIFRGNLIMERERCRLPTKILSTMLLPLVFL